MTQPLGISHLHAAFADFPAALQWFKTVLQAEVIEESPQMAVLRFADFDLAVHPSWGDGDSSFTLAFRTTDCRAHYDTWVARGARPRTEPRDKGPVWGADVFGPGKLVIELEQSK